MDAAGQVLAASAPRGGAITFWSVAERRYLSSLPLGDGCGVAPSGEPGGFLASSGYGRLVHHNALSGQTTRLDDSGATSVARATHLLALTLQGRASKTGTDSCVCCGWALAIDARALDQPPPGRRGGGRDRTSVREEKGGGAGVYTSGRRYIQ